MAFVAAATGGSIWRNVIENGLRLILAATPGVGFPIAARTRAIPTHLPQVLVELQAGGHPAIEAEHSNFLIDTILGIPIYPATGTDANDLDLEYPDGTWTDTVLAQE